MDADEAAEWYRRAADQKNAAALFDFSVCCYEGKGVKRDPWEALRLASLAAENAVPPDERYQDWERWLKLELACSTPPEDHEEPLKLIARLLEKHSFEAEHEIQLNPLIQSEIKSNAIWDFLGQLDVPKRHRHNLVDLIEHYIEHTRCKALFPHHSIELIHKKEQYRKAEPNELQPEVGMDANNRLEKTIKFLTTEGVPKQFLQTVAEEILCRIDQICGVSPTQEALPFAQSTAIPESWQEAKSQIPGLMKWEEAKAAAKKESDAARKAKRVAPPRFTIFDWLGDEMHGLGRWTRQEPGFPRAALLAINDEPAYDALNSSLSRGNKIPSHLYLPTKEAWTDIVASQAKRPGNMPYHVYKALQKRRQTAAK